MGTLTQLFLVFLVHFFFLIIKNSFLNKLTLITKRGFPGGSDSKESAWNAGDPGSVPGLGRSHGENGYPFHSSGTDVKVGP